MGILAFERAPRRAGPRTSYFQLGNAPFWAVHLTALGGAICYGVSLAGVALALGAYFARMVLVTAGYHRYFSHRAFKTGRAFQFVLAVLAQSSAQKGVLWWASHHRRHHRTSDTPAGCALAPAARVLVRAPGLDPRATSGPPPT